LLDDVLRAISGAADGTIVPQLAARLDRLERLSHGGRATYVGNNRVLTKAVINDTVLGFLVQADDRLIVPHIIVHGDYESTLTSYFATAISAGDHCLDVGANYGYYTCLMAGIAHQGKTIGIEPDAAVFELLRDNICINSYEMLATALHAAVADAPGRLTLHRRVTRSGNTSITRLTEESVRWLGEKAPESFEVDCLSIDDLLLSHFGGRIDVMKVDVEGAEPLVFRGARQAIAANPQVKIVMEWSPGQIQAAGFDLAEFLAALEALRLEAAAVGPTGPVPIAFADLMNAPFHPGILLTVRR
jgi:FkbM family methyltransferase